MDERYTKHLPESVVELVSEDPSRYSVSLRSRMVRVDETSMDPVYYYRRVEVSVDEDWETPNYRVYLHPYRPSEVDTLREVRVLVDRHLDSKRSRPLVETLLPTK